MLDENTVNRGTYVLFVILVLSFLRRRLIAESKRSLDTNAVIHN